jgi:hypothetical protein
MPRTGKLAISAMVTFLAIVSMPPAASAGGAGGALVVGDSLEVLTSPYLKRYLPGVPLTVNAEGGYNSYQIFDLFEESYDPSQSVIVFDAGTNDNPAYPQILAENLAAVADTIGDRCMVVPTIHGLTVNGIGNAGKNRVVAEFAASRPGTQVPDWAGAVATHPELMQSDDLHPIAQGADLRAQLIAQGIKGCLAFSFAPARKPELRPKPNLAYATTIAERQAGVVSAIEGGLLRSVAAEVARRERMLAAALAVFLLRSGCEDRCHA